MDAGAPRLDAKDGDGLIERVLPVAARDPDAAEATYRLTVYTSDLKYAGTDANVACEIIGAKGTTGARRPRPPRRAGGLVSGVGPAGLYTLATPPRSLSQAAARSLRGGAALFPSRARPPPPGRLKLENSKNNFERGARDEFTLPAKNVGEIQTLAIGHDNAGLGPGWHLRSVEVYCVQTRQTVRHTRSGWAI